MVVEKKKTTKKPVRTAPRKKAATAGKTRKQPDDKGVQTATAQKSSTGNLFSQEELEHFYGLLLARRSRILGDVGVMEGNDHNGNRLENTGDLSNMPIHMADIGTDNYEKEFTLGLIESDRKQLREIYRAIIKIREGNYGICEATGEPISKARLEAKPEARYCVEFAAKLEKGLVSPPTESDDNNTSDENNDDDD